MQTFSSEETGDTRKNKSVPNLAATVRGDNPIRREQDDTLGRTAAARSFAKQVLSLDASEGVVVGVLGPWGSGKTSFVNLARSEFESAGVPILEFNPWMFSGAQQLVESFFVELAAQLKLRPGLGEIGENLAYYGEMFSGMGWLPFVGPWTERARLFASVIGAISKHRKQGIGVRRNRIEKALADLSNPILIVLDDIDRLSSSEIRDMFRLVRLTASFPNLIYIVAFDRRRVEDALAEQGVPGRSYLEKILQIAIDLPAVPNSALIKQIATAVDTALSGIENPGPFDEQVWPDIFAEIVRPLIRNMRDVRRYAVSVKGTVAALDGQVALADVLGLEAIRVFLPDVFAKLHGAVDALTTTAGSAWGSHRESPELRKQVEGLIAAAQEHAYVVRAVIGRMFFAALRHIGNTTYADEWKVRWLRARRVAHEDVLRFYLERITGEGLQSFADAERAWALFDDRDALDHHLRSVDKNRLQDVIASLETYEDQFKAEHAVPATIVVLNLLPDIPERQGNMLELPSRFTVTRIVLRLLRPLETPNRVEAAVREILPQLKSLSSKQELIRLIGHEEGAGHKLVSEEATADFQKSWRCEVRSSAAAELIQERDLGSILFKAQREAGPSEGTLIVPDSTEVTLAVLRSARGEVRSQTLGSRAVRRTFRLDWDALIELYGNEQILRERIKQLRTTDPKGVGDLLDLAEKYLSGWRPDRRDFAP